jgi:hypothetical protein
MIIDAMDESKEHELTMRAFGKILDRQLPSLHMILTSRRENGILTSLRQMQHFDEVVNSLFLEIHLVDQDIDSFVRSEIVTNVNLQKWMKLEQLRGSIEQKLSKNAKGMYVAPFHTHQTWRS